MGIIDAALKRMAAKHDNLVLSSAQNIAKAADAMASIHSRRKKEDVRKDAIVMNCLRVMERILGESVEGLKTN